MDISFTVCLFVCLCVRLRISPPRTKLAAPHFARRFIGIQGRESLIFVNFAPPEAQNWTNRPPVCKHTVEMGRRKRHARDAPFVDIARRVEVGSACVDKGQSSLTYSLKFLLLFVYTMPERIRGSYDDALYKSTYTLLYFTNIIVLRALGLPPTVVCTVVYCRLIFAANCS